MEKLKFNKMKLLKSIVNLLFVFSVPFLSLVFYVDHELVYIKYILVVSFFCGIYLNRRYFNKYIYSDFNYKYLIVSILLGLYTVKKISVFSVLGSKFVYNLLTRNIHLDMPLDKIKIIISLFAAFSFILIIYILIKTIFPFIKNQYRSLTKLEKRFIIITLVIGMLATTFLYSLTNAFYLPKVNNKVVKYDILYTSDSGSLVSQDTFINVGAEENDIRQPLFAVFALPFAIGTSLLSEFIFFLPEIVLFNVSQIFLLIISFIMLSRMLELDEKNRLLFLIFSTCTFSTILFSFMIEQYVLAFFYVVLTLYVNYNNQNKTNYCYIGAVSTLLISGILFYLIDNISKIKNYIVSVFKCLVMFLITLVITGQALEFFDFILQIKSLMRFGGNGISFYDKILQFLNFVSSIFIGPKSNIAYVTGKYRYFMDKVNSINFLGLIIIVLCLISILIIKKNKIVIQSFIWILFSFVILCLLGWGTNENGLILYSLYFSWGYTVLIFLLINKVFNKYSKYIIIGLSLIILTINIYHLSQILLFGIKYYPVF